ncbi:unnamed protein product [Pichia kudriavzevii]
MPVQDIKGAKQSFDSKSLDFNGLNMDQNGAGYTSMQSPSTENPNVLSLYKDITSSGELPIRPSSQPVRTRNRGYSLRTQLLNTHLVKQSENYLEDHNNEQDIELASVGNTYTPDGYTRNKEEYNENDQFGTDFVNDSMLDFSEDLKNIKDAKFISGKNGVKLSNEFDDKFDRDDDYRLKSKTKLMMNNNAINFFKKMYILLSGGRIELSSVGGREIPISINLNNTDFPKILDKQNKPLLIDNRQNKPYVDNLITSSKYTLWSFLPRQLYAQFSKLANCYFMTIAIFQLIPNWSTTGTSTTIIPLSIFITIAMLREGWDDMKRHKLDKEENHRHTKVLKELESPKSLFESDMRFSKSTASFSRLRPSGQSFDLEFEDDLELEREAESKNSYDSERLLHSMGVSANKIKWKDVKVGDIVKLECDEWVPADMILLTSTNELGEAFVETMALDGETNLKSKIPNIELHKKANRAKSLFNLTGKVLSEDPNNDLYNYEGSIDLPNMETQEMETYPLGPDQILYRGSILRNTDSCLGLVIFTGEETKIRMNAIKNPRIKAPKLQKKINMIVGFMVFVVITLSLFSFMAQNIFQKKYGSNMWYTLGTQAGVVPTIMGFIIMYNTLIPLSLYITMEMIKVVQLQLLQWDIDMYHLPSDTPAEARTATILEELGQVSYIFSDKTGTLTDNVMIFRKFSVCGVPWLHNVDVLLKGEQHNDPNDISDVFKDSEEKPGMLITDGRPSMASLNQIRKQQGQEEEEKKKHDSIKTSFEFIQFIQSNPSSVFAEKATLFLLSLALCHTCLPRRFMKDTPQSGDNDSIDSIDRTSALNPFASDQEEGEESIEYQAASPDELALVQAACDMGFILFDKKLKTVTLKTFPKGFDNESKLTKYEILDVIEFSSARKRMSVIVKFPNDEIIMFCKGADNVILERLHNSAIVSEKQREIDRSIEGRKKAEAEFILNKRSIDQINSATSPRSSFGTVRRSLSLSRKSMANDAYGNIDSMLENENDVDELVKMSRKSIEVESRKKYNLSKNQYIPPVKLLKNEKFLIERTLRHIDDFSSEGLRTLLYSYRKLNENEYKEWSRRYAEAKTSLVDRADNIAKVGTEFENNLILLGCTAIEDKLQEGVPEAIEKLRRAGIRMWMLTGDKRETAINIGYSCKLIKDYSKVVILSLDRENQMDDIVSTIKETEMEIYEESIAHCVVVIDGSTLTEVEKDEAILSLFIRLGVQADSVIVCRASPSQKANMVTKVRNLDKSKVTLAIGDGANDIAMIQSADVGIGITGKEGLQAARTSDYSIAQFRYLLKLLLVHGRYNYIRTSKFVLCTFYKELMFYLSQLIYQRYTMFTGSSMYESWSLSMFNTLFTSLPVLCIGMYDRDLNQSTLIAVPELYHKGVKNETFNLPVFIQWVLLATSQSVTVSFVLFQIYGFPALLDNTTYPLGVVLFTTFIIIINVKLNIVEMHTITKVSIISAGVSIGGWILWCMLLVGLYKTKLSTIYYVEHGLFEHFGKDFTFWASILILTVVGIWIDLIFYLVSHLFYTTETEKYQILEKDERLQKRFEIESYNELKQGWLWLHESQIKEGKIDELKGFKRFIFNLKSFLKKGSLHPTEKTQSRKRKGTMINPNELPPDTPSIVVVSSNDEYTEEMLPSGKTVKVPKNQGNGEESRYRRFFKSRKSSFDEFNDGRSIDEILRDRQRGLEYDESHR